jgi:hypothetical protein
MYVESAFRYRRQGREVLEVTDSGEREGVSRSVEYAIGTIAAAAFAAILDTVVTGDSIVAAMTNIIARALNTKV